jgi:MoxR-like ATPase
MTTAPASQAPDAPYDQIQALIVHLEQVITGQRPALRKLLAALLAGGHVLLEDLPGTGKTTLAKALARSLTLEFRRVQFTPDLLPSDILGVSIFDPRDQSFHFHSGPIFTDILLADELNRASPRVQSALLEAMGEYQVSIDGRRRPLSAEFFVIATQNPVELHGTYPLPEAQLDRFALRFGLGYVTPEAELEILQRQADHHPLEDLQPCLGLGALGPLREAAKRVRISNELCRYIVHLVGRTRSADGVLLGASPRASLTLMRTAQALSLVDGRDFVSPEPIHELAIPVLAHRLKVNEADRYGGRTEAHVISELLEQTPVPV